ncbi:SDR family NAD(P)-dependent oxidoreductase [Microlunatus speluncae]|uniref:SDR family NAD(P)-dependent oxidoreductase n=1 Tax=Microlunatus speluncae TaxID=2594267 RepID=UPI001C2DE310|nr:SDR family NAD(P)-dependent oxidoreductase [Microlunatus speluncae]
MHPSKTWLITGASRGLGRALAVAVAEAGDVVVATVRGDHELPDHERIHVQRLDVRDHDGAVLAVRRATAETGRLDVLINNAGYGLVGATEEVTETEARAIIDTDLLGPLWLTQAALPVMRAQGSGHIVQVSTVGAVGTLPFFGLYNAAKWGLEGFSGALAAEVRPHGIRVTIAELGSIDTSWSTGSLRFAEPNPAYHELRRELFGTVETPWATGGTGGGMAPEDAARVLHRHISEPVDDRLRLLIGDDAPEHVAIALGDRIADYAKDERFPAERLLGVRTS